MRSIYILLISVLLFSCKSNDRPDIASVPLKTLSGEDFTFNQKELSGTLVFCFMSPECPLCINYTRTILDLKQKFDTSDVHFFAIYPGTYYSAGQIDSFTVEYKFDIQALLDADYKFTDLLNATVTPEVVLINHQGEKVYSGAIDDWAFAPGKKKQVITKRYLEDAINKVRAGDYPTPSKTEPVGCYIELK